MAYEQDRQYILSTQAPNDNYSYPTETYSYNYVTNNWLNRDVLSRFHMCQQMLREVITLVQTKIKST